MLRKEDCKPGVLVIAIKQDDGEQPKLVIGGIYTIKNYREQIFTHTGIEYYPNIAIEEVNQSSNMLNYGYNISCFKLHRPEELIELFRINEIDIKSPIKEEELV